MTMDSPYNLQFRVTNHLHHRVLSPESHVVRHQDQPNHQQNSQPLRFSVANILRPDFGREAIKTASKSVLSTTAIPVQLPQDNSLSLPRDLSLSSARLSPPPSTNYAIHRERDSFSHSGLTSPMQRLSRSGSLESLASSRSSVTSTSITSAPSSSSTSSTVGTDSLNGDSTSGSNANTSTSQKNNTNSQNPLWPAWVYCTRYSDRPSSGKCSRYFFRIFLYIEKFCKSNMYAIIVHG